MTFVGKKCEVVGMWLCRNSIKDKAQTALFKDPVRTAL